MCHSDMLVRTCYVGEETDLACKVVGVNYYRGLATLDESLLLIREPRNAYDSNAIRVDNVANIQVGQYQPIPFVSLSLSVALSFSASCCCLLASLTVLVFQGIWLLCLHHY